MTNPTELRDLIRSVVAAHPQEGDSALSPSWATFIELGLPGVGVAENEGGSGGSLSDVAVLVSTAAEHGVSCPLIESTVAHWILAGDGEIDGSAATVALTEQNLGSDETISATLSNVPWARMSQRLIVIDGAGSSRIVSLDDERVTIEPATNISGEPRDTVRIEGFPARVLPNAPPAELVRARLGVLWSAALAGAANGAYELTRRYVNERNQFGRPLADIPAVAASLATMRVYTQQQGAALQGALSAWEGTPEPKGCLVAAAITRITAGVAAGQVAARAHQLHGAIGITHEYPLHHLTRRLWAWRDAETSQHSWARWLGGVVVSGGEASLWVEVSA
ncbi:acyl-CoA dehydrogenase family protein [Mycolicibacterium sp. P9-22]|uniref:acyl-CoA dehydrogenase family protein n=1 Tax=Mycolicibacterium sp. P9-22 TaxID=2024613 RepID=UPI001883E5F2|nr:acyl-CoA dehydrogenase family protein [Mycolicibacterium sp. P9-22]